MIKCLLDNKMIEKFDLDKIHKVYDIWPQIAREQYEREVDVMDYGKISHVVFAGMGGSGAIGDIFSSILSKTPTHIDIIKGYQLPKTVNSESLVVTTSISGNTEETLSVLSEAVKLKSKIIAFSNGGKMEKVCLENGINYRKIPMKHSPRASFPIFLFAILRTLESFIPIEKNDILESLKKLKELNEKISSKNLTVKNPALKLANEICEGKLLAMGGGGYNHGNIAKTWTAIVHEMTMN